jgi:NADPH2:quinone reductase
LGRPFVVHSQSFATGQRVWLRGGGLGTSINGTWCELIDAPDEVVGLLPDNLSAALGSAFFSPCTSAWTALHEVAQLQAGEHVLVTGVSGAVGSITVQLAMEAGASVTAVISSRSRAADLPAGVAAVVLDPDSPKCLDGLGVDVLIDTVGGWVLAAALPCVAPGGRAVLVGYTAGPTLTLDIEYFLQRDVRLLPLNMFRRESSGRACGWM